MGGYFSGIPGDRGAQRNVRSRFRLHSRITDAEASVLIQFTIKSARKVVVEQPMTVGLTLAFVFLFLVFVTVHCAPAHSYQKMILALHQLVRMTFLTVRQLVRMIYSIHLLVRMTFLTVRQLVSMTFATHQLSIILYTRILQSIILYA